MIAWGGAGLFDGAIMFNEFHSTAALSLVASPELNKLLDAGEQSIDPEKRKQAYAGVQKYIMENALGLSAWQQSTIFGVNKRLNWDPQLDSQVFFNRIALKS